MEKRLILLQVLCKYERLARENSERFKGKYVGKNNPNYKNGDKLYPKIALDNLPNECIACQRGNIKFEVHHIDGNRKNNTLINFAIMCLSCHRRIHKVSEKFELSLKQALEVVKLTGHLQGKKGCRRSKTAVEEIEAAVQRVKNL